MSRGRKILTDPSAQSEDPSLPGFLSKPEGAPVYHGFPVVGETMTDGWCFGAITDFSDPDGCSGGDAFVVAPDGSRAGLIWEVGDGPPQQVLPPDEERWGVYSVWFPKTVRNVDDLVHCFRTVLPSLQAIHAQIKGHAS